MMIFHYSMFKLAIEQGIFDVESYPNPVFYDYIV